VLCKLVHCDSWVIIDLVWVIRIYFASLEDGAFSFVLVRGFYLDCPG
jgi:hypothetical protein